MNTQTFKIICLDTKTELDTVLYPSKFSAREVLEEERGEYTNQSTNIWVVSDSDFAYKLAEMENVEPLSLSNNEHLYNEAVILGILHPETLETFGDYLY